MHACMPACSSIFLGLYNARCTIGMEFNHDVMRTLRPLSSIKPFILPCILSCVKHLLGVVHLYGVVHKEDGRWSHVMLCCSKQKRKP